MTDPRAERDVLVAAVVDAALDLYRFGMRSSDSVLLESRFNNACRALLLHDAAPTSAALGERSGVGEG